MYMTVIPWPAIAGQLRLVPLVILLISGLGLCLLEWRALPARTGPPLAQHWQEADWPARGMLLLLALTVLPTLIAPLCPPLALDGRLNVNGWLRYPWFPFNADLLFSAAMLTYDDVMSHLLSALTA
ncbi:hypothetical protein ACN9MZ_05305 [Pseudoduganella sp. S-14]|uniref:hypothetical protein n=1 Tax=Pseudoduganella sp. S-14 TaxID=3404065 RepID=UPI003CFA75C7